MSYRGWPWLARSALKLVESSLRQHIEITNIVNTRSLVYQNEHLEDVARKVELCVLD